MSTSDNRKRLEQIEDTHGRCVRLQYDTISWLIKQAKRGQLMEQYRFESEMHLDLYEKVLATNKKLGETLEFYANERNYDSPIFDEHGQFNGSLIDKDSGEKARQVLDTK